jgi:hypothetical protein
MPSSLKSWLADQGDRDPGTRTQPGPCPYLPQFVLAGGWRGRPAPDLDAVLSSSPRNSRMAQTEAALVTGFSPFPMGSSTRSPGG